MTNLIEFTLQSELGERYLAISPVLLHLREMPSLKPPLNVYVYEGLILQDWSSLFSEEINSISTAFHTEMRMIKPDQDLKKAYLGYLVKPNENEPWQNDGNLTGLSAEAIKQLEHLINTHRRPNAD